MSTDPEETVEIDGHTVDAHLVDQFFDGKTGLPISDAEWDETKRRIETAKPSIHDAPFTGAV